MLELAVIEVPSAATASLDPIRRRLLAELAEPGSATTLGARMGLPRQKVNYHLRELERHGLVELFEERRRGNMTERVLRATAASYLISPAALGDLAPDPRRGVDQLSARWMLAVAARLVQEVGTLLMRAAIARKPLATLTIDSELSFASAADRAAFAAELSRTIAELGARYGSAAGETNAQETNTGETSSSARPHRLIVALHPSITPEGTARHAATEVASNQIDS